VATQQKKKVLALETAAFQFSLFNELSDAQQEQFLMESLDDMRDGKLRKEMADLEHAWLNSDAKMLSHLIDDILNEKSMSAEFTQHVLLDRRNPSMADKVEGLLKHDKVTFVGVGLMHLIGDKGVPQLLRRRGYLVERVY